MMKKLLLVILVFFPLNVAASECAPGELMLEYVDVQTFAPTDVYMVRLSGILETPNPGYAYTFSVEAKKGERTQATLSLHERTPGMITPAVISSLTIDETFNISHVSQGLFIDVIKTFNWGPEYYQAKFPGGFGQHKSTCMKPEMYK